MSENAPPEAIDRDAFARLMAPFEPFEPQPTLAVAVSGGADSMALALLLRDWTAARQGRLWALVVDHGMRPESGDEAHAVGAALQAAGIAHRVLTWQGRKPATGLQAAARTARYDLLCAFCRQRNILHLCLGHHRDDQAETYLLRRQRGSGAAGLAAMAPLRHLAQLRLLRPFLSLPKARLTATLRKGGLSWVEDPSNRDPRFARGRLRRQRMETAAADLQAADICAKAKAYGHARQEQQAAVGRFLGRHAAMDQAGFLTLERAALQKAAPALARTSLAACVACVGGRPYGPRSERLARLQGALTATDFPGATLGRVSISPRGDRLLFCRENRGLAPCRFSAGESGRWDGRFDVALSAAAGQGPFEVRALGHDGLRQLRSDVGRASCGLPVKVCVTLPSLWDNFGLIFVPHLRYSRSDWQEAAAMEAIFRPESTLLAAYMLV